MSAGLLSTPLFRATDSTGAGLAFGKVYTYLAGTNTPLPSYTDATAKTKNANPVILDSNGEAPIWLASAKYKIVVKDSNDVTIYEMDDVQSSSVIAGSEWTVQADVFTYIDSTTFKVPGNRTIDYIVGRRFRGMLTSSGLFVYGTINNVIYTTETIITVTFDTASQINNTLSEVALGRLAVDCAENIFQSQIDALTRSITNVVNNITIGNIIWSVVDATSPALTMADGSGVFADTTAGTFNVTLPANPTLSSTVHFADPAGLWSTTSFHILGNGKNIMGAADFFNVDVSWHGFKLVFDGTEWRLA